MDKLWRLMEAIFYLVIALLLFVVAGLFMNTAIAAINVYGALILALIGIGKGAFAIIDHNKENKVDENE